MYKQGLHLLTLTSEHENVIVEPDETQPSTSGLNINNINMSVNCSMPNLAVAVEAENYVLQKELADITEKQKKATQQFSYQQIMQDDKLVLLYTGLPNNTIFAALYELLNDIEINYYLGWKVEEISREDQLFLSLMKLWQNPPQADLAVRFNISQATVSNIILTWIHVLHETLFKQLMSAIPSRHKNKTCLPSSFSSFTNCRIIIDCTEIYTAIPRSIELQRLTYSNYRHCNTWKMLVGVAPNGCITYVSDLYAGSTSNKKLTKHCGILEQLEAGDLILADKGFLIKDILPEGVNIIIPPFLDTAQFTPAQVKQTERIARARIPVERAIQRMKAYNILNVIPQGLLQHADVVCQVVGALTNLQYSLIAIIEEFYNESD